MLSILGLYTWVVYIQQLFKLHLRAEKKNEWNLTERYDIQFP